jgi:hypothetical protein
MSFVPCNSVPGNVVLNCSFENAIFGANWNFNPLIVVSDPEGFQSATAARINPSVTLESLCQTVPTVNNTPYVWAFWAKHTANSGTREFSFTINGVDVSAGRRLNTEYTYYVTPFVSDNSGSTTICFDARITSPDYLVDQVIVTFPTNICYSGESLVRTRNIQSGEIGDTPAKFVTSDMHEVFSCVQNKFVPVIYNIVTGPTQKFFIIEKDSLAVGLPSHDFLVTGGHCIELDGKIVKVRDIPSAKKIPVVPQPIYSICISKKSPILINGLNVLAWKKEQWDQNVIDNFVIWSNNQIPNQTSHSDNQIPQSDNEISHSDNEISQSE